MKPKTLLLVALALGAAWLLLSRKAAAATGPAAPAGAGADSFSELGDFSGAAADVLESLGELGELAADPGGSSSSSSASSSGGESAPAGGSGGYSGGGWAGGGGGTGPDGSQTHIP